MSALDAFWAAPPVTRTLAAAVLIESVLSALTILNPYYLVYHSSYIFKLTPEVWRFASTFLLTFKFGIIMDPIWIWQNGAPLERSSTRFNSASFFIYIVFVCSVLIPLLAVTVPGTEEDYPYTSQGPIIRKSFTGPCCGVGMVGVSFEKPAQILFCVWRFGTPTYFRRTRILAGHFLGSMLLLGPLSLAITYTYAQENRGQRASFFIINMDVKWLPYARIAMTFLMNGPDAAMTDATGIVAAHLYDFLTVYWPTYGGGSSLLRTPRFVQRWFYGDGPAVETKGHGTAFQARPRPGSQNTTTGSTSSVWNSRGPGRRLGE